MSISGKLITLRTLIIPRKACGAVFLLLFSFAVLSGSSYPLDGKNVLILNSGSSRDITSNIIVNTIKHQLIRSAPFTNFYIEDLNLEAFSDTRYYSIVKDFLQKKYSSKKFNLVITIEAEALKFVVLYRESFFKECPVIFCGSGMQYQEIIKGQKQITGVVTEADFENTLKLAVRLHPERRKMLILADSSITSLSLLAKVKNSEKLNKGLAEFIYLVNISDSDIIDTLKMYEQDGTLLLLGSSFIRPGVLQSDDVLSQRLAAKLRIPVYGFGKGVLDNKIGGSFVNPTLPAKLAASYAINILDGADIADYPVRSLNDPTYSFNYEQLTRFGVEPGKLPSNSKIRGIPQPFFEKYINEIYIAAEGLIAALIISVLLFNILKRRKTEKALKESEERFKSLYENVPIGIYRTTPGGKILMANPAMIKTLGYSSLEELIKTNLGEDHIKAGYKREVFISEIEKHGYVKDYQDTWVKKNGEVIYLRETAKLTTDGRGKPLYYEGILEDITDKKIAEIELERYVQELQENKEIIERNAAKLEELNGILAQSEKKLIELNQSKDKFFSILSHDLRSPFNSLIGFTDLLVKNFDDFSTEEIKAISQNIHNSLTHLYELIENILQWSGLQTGKITFNPEMINLRRIAEQVKELLKGTAVKKSIIILISIPDGVYAYADRFMLFSVIQNLISNALKFTNAGGEISVSAKSGGRFCEVTISDNGIGMKPEELEQVFRLDSSLSRAGTSGEKGTGLGLILCKELTERNGGKIFVESEYRKGTRFVFTVPEFSK